MYLCTVKKQWQLDHQQCGHTSEWHSAANINQRPTNKIREQGLSGFCNVNDNASRMNLLINLYDDYSHDLGCTGHRLQLVIKAGLDLPQVVEADEDADAEKMR